MDGGQPWETDFMKGQWGSQTVSSRGSSYTGVALIDLIQSKLVCKKC